MAQINITIEGVGAAVKLFERKITFGKNLMRNIGRPAARAVKAVIGQEFAGQFYQGPAGRRAWARTHGFGERQAGRPGLGGTSGRPNAAWQGASPRITATTLELRARYQGAGVHAGGVGTQRSHTTTVVRPRKFTSSGRPHMQIKLAADPGIKVFLSAARLKRGLEIESRPHANPNNPVTARRIERVMEVDFEKA